MTRETQFGFSLQAELTNFTVIITPRVLAGSYLVPGQVRLKYK